MRTKSRIFSVYMMFSFRTDNAAKNWLKVAKLAIGYEKDRSIFLAIKIGK